MSDDSGADEPPAERPRFSTRALVGAAACAVALVAVLGWGLVAAAQGGLGGVAGYLQNAALAVVSILAGWIISILMKQSSDFDSAVAEQRRVDDLARNAQSAVNRLVAIAASISRVFDQTRQSEACNVGELRIRMRVISTVAELTLQHADDALRDWRRLSPEVVDSEVEAAQRNYLGGRDRSNDQPEDDVEEDNQ